MMAMQQKRVNYQQMKKFTTTTVDTRTTRVRSHRWRQATVTVQRAQVGRMIEAGMVRLSRNTRGLHLLMKVNLFHNLIKQKTDLKVSFRSKLEVSSTTPRLHFRIIRRLSELRRKQHLQLRLKLRWSAWRGRAARVEGKIWNPKEQTRKVAQDTIREKLHWRSLGAASSVDQSREDHERKAGSSGSDMFQRTKPDCELEDL